MKGYFKKLQGYVYEGGLKAATPVVDGTFVERDKLDNVKAISAKKSLTLRYLAKEGDMVLLEVVELGADDIYFVEMAETEENIGLVGDDTAKAIPAGSLIRAKRPLAGEIICMKATISQDIGSLVCPAGADTFQAKI